MKQDTKETIGSRGTVAGFRPLIGEERWLFEDYKQRHLSGGKRPLLYGENGVTHGMLYPVTKRPLPPPQVETFEAHGHVWYRHVPGEACPVEPDVIVDGLLEREMPYGGYYSEPQKSQDWDWASSNDGEDIIGYRFPDFPAVHTTLQQQQPSADTQDTTKQRLLTMYHGWCDVVPDSVAECIADVAKVLYPTDADRCEAEFQKWWNAGSGYFSERVIARAAWAAAWSAAKQKKP